MGEVYLVSDTKLNRKAALKILPVKFAVDRKHLNRFLQEARLAATLNHPNICTVYEIDERNEPPFIAMEYVEGVTLAEKVDSRQLETGEILEIAAEIADALDEAHRHGIIHRDIKSANIIINKRGRVKVLDFGLAKTFEAETSEQEITRAKTESGMLVGTVQYMSPEQALGKDLDGRTDLWSLGVLLYEMATGQLPFKGATVAGTFDAILNQEPPLPSELAPDLPPALEQIILKLLEKDRELRYQTASDLRADLRRLQRNSSISVRRVSGETLARSVSAQPRNTDSTVAKRTDTVFVQKTQNDLKVTGKFPLYAALTLAALIFAVIGGYAIYSNLTKPEKVAASFQQTELERLTNIGKITDGVISPDGKYIAYAIDDNGSESLWIKQLGTNTKLQIVAPANISFQGIAISHDSNWIYYNIWDKKGVGQIFRAPTIGSGTPQKVVHDCMPGVILSPDGKKVAFVRSDSKNNRALFLTANTNDGSDERELINSQFQEFGIIAAAWSPDGQSIAYSGFKPTGGGQNLAYINEIPATGGESRTIWSAPNTFIGDGLVWLPGKRGLLLTISNRQQLLSQVWEVPYQNGEARQVTKDFNSYGTLSLTADGKSLLSIQQDFNLSVWVVPADNPAQARRITTGKVEGIGIAWASDNRVVYGSTVSGNQDIWITNTDGSNKRQLTNNAGSNSEPCSFANGEQIAFVSLRGGIPQVWRTDVNTGEAAQMTTGAGAYGVACAFREDSVYTLSIKNTETPYIWRTSVKGEEVPIEIKQGLNYRPALSPDGRRVAYIYWDEAEQRLKQQIQTIETGAAQPFQLPVTAIRGVNQPPIIFRWTGDGKALSYISDENEVSNIWTLPLSSDVKPKQITNFNESYILYFDWSPDGKQLAISRGTRTSDVVLIKDIK